MKTNNDINDKINTKMRTNFSEKNNKYTCIFHCPITINDCINSIDLIEDKVIIGTLMGDVFLCRVDESKLSVDPKTNKDISIPPLYLKNVLENDDSNIQLNNEPLKNKLDSFKLSDKLNKKSKTNTFELYYNNYETNKENENIKKENKKSLQFPKITQLIIRSKENIPSLEFVNNDMINICIGDLEIIHLENMSTFNKNDENSTYNYSKLRNYKTENDHLEYCESALCFLKNSCFLIIFTKLAEFEDNLEISEISYENKNLSSGEIIKGEIKLSNYIVPFDFNGDMFLFVDYHSKDDKFIGIEYTSSLKPRYIYNLKKKKQFGHISHMKIMSDEMIFLVRNEIQCEIRYLNDDFEIIEKYEHLGTEVISCCFFYQENGESLIELIDDNSEYEANIKKQKEELNKSNGEKKEDDIIKLFGNKLNYKDNKEKSTLINTNIATVNNARYKSKSRMEKHTHNIQSDNINNLNIYGKANKIMTSFDKNNIKNIYNKNNGTDISLKIRRSISINSNSALINQFIDKSSSSRKKINIHLNYNHTLDNNNKKLIKDNILFLYNNRSPKIPKRKMKNKVGVFSSIEIFDKNNNNNIIERNKKKDLEENKTILKYSDSYKYYNIVTLDGDGTVYLYHKKSQKYLFNIYDINNIKQKYKNIGFFGTGFPYFIKANENYFCITTDFGLFVFSKMEK